MSYINAQIPRFGESGNRCQRMKDESELKFWREYANSLEDELRNIFDYATEHGCIQLHHGRDILKLVVVGSEPPKEGSHA